MSFLRKARPDAVDPAALERQAEESLKVVNDNREHVNFITAWLVNRKDQNGFGDDFEYTLRPRGVK